MNLGKENHAKIIAVIVFAVIGTFVLAGIQFATNEDDSSTTTNGQIASGETATFTGLISEVFTDCEDHFILDGNGGVAEHSEPVTCDGGSYIVVDDNKILTSSGFTANSESFSKHNSGWRPGTVAGVTAREAATTPGLYTLDCEECAVDITSSLPVEPEGPVTINGVVSEAFSDCTPVRTLDEQGEVRFSAKPYTCDGGSYIVVDGRQIRTAAGNSFTPGSFDKHDVDIQPGDSVQVTAARELASSDLYTLDCNTCGIN